MFSTFSSFNSVEAASILGFKVPLSNWCNETSPSHQVEAEAFNSPAFCSIYSLPSRRSSKQTAHSWKCVNSDGVTSQPGQQTPSWHRAAATVLYEESRLNTCVHPSWLFWLCTIRMNQNIPEFLSHHLKMLISCSLTPPPPPYVFPALPDVLGSADVSTQTALILEQPGDVQPQARGPPRVQHGSNGLRYSVRWGEIVREGVLGKTCSLVDQ